MEQNVNILYKKIDQTLQLEYSLVYAGEGMQATTEYLLIQCW